MPQPTFLDRGVFSREWDYLERDIVGNVVAFKSHRFYAYASTSAVRNAYG